MAIFNLIGLNSDVLIFRPGFGMGAQSMPVNQKMLPKTTVIHIFENY